MVRNIRFLSLALVAALAMGVAGVSTAAAAVEFRSEKAPVTATGVQEGLSNAFDVQFGEVKCKVAEYNATTTTSTDTTVKITPNYEECTAWGVAATIDMNGCTYQIHVDNSGPPYTGTADVVCDAGKQIVVTGGTKCIVDISAQTGLGPISFTNIGTTSTREITVGLSGIHNIKYTQTPGSGVGKCGSVTTSGGNYTGTATVTGETDPGTTHTGLFVS